MTDPLHVATLNIRNIADRWEERLPLLLADMRALQPDVIGLQEIVYPMQQDRLLGAAGAARYRVVRAYAGRPEYGNSLLVREPLEPAAEERLDLGLNRSAIRVLLRLPAGSTLVFAATHLHHVPADESQRDEQAAKLIAWLSAAPPADGQIVVGDFNAEPDEPACQRMRGAGYRSANAEANGKDPAVTWPSGIQAPGMDTDGDPGCLDYVWLLGNVRAIDAGLAFDRPAAEDPTLYPSDHLGIAAHVVVGE